MTRRPFVLDMETSDPDDFITLLLLLGHPEVDLRAVTITPGTREQVDLVLLALAWFKRKDVEVGAFNIGHPKQCVSRWHYDAYGFKRRGILDPVEDGWRVLKRHLGPGTTLVTGAPLKNLGKLLETQQVLSDLQHPCFGRLVIQGGFAGEGVVPPDQQLEKFCGRTTCPTFNLNGDPRSALEVLRLRSWFEDLRFVSKNVCHGVRFDESLLDRFKTTVCGSHVRCDCPCHQDRLGLILHDRPCCTTCPWCGMAQVDDPITGNDRAAKARSLILQGMGYYLQRHPGGKALHDPLAACCAIDSSVGEWAEVELFRERGEWGSRIAPGSGVRISVGYDHDRFVETFLMQALRG